ncbi:hypothetical protein PSE10B_57560 [Pseudomonas amygdali pv. eriobotryae]|uniref:hypothetical protein n=1 Tax=Priestia megaterium TaxID=1404 RepID=UPI000EB75A24|nr:hypothetical protein [Priestia megaterium]AYE53903.1 hypothetical protein OEA_30290 [Priestia megaterium NCT-2]GFZ69234.1 hypothetical protein PSE10B_57560 [Pseudomonas amygdali pv. eriobotryae]
MASKHHSRGNGCGQCNVIFVTFNQTTGRVIAITPSIGTIPPACVNETFIQDVTACLLRDGYNIQAFYQSNFDSAGIPTEETFVFSKC